MSLPVGLIGQNTRHGIRIRTIMHLKHVSLPIGVVGHIMRPKRLELSRFKATVSKTALSAIPSRAHDTLDGIRTRTFTRFKLVSSASWDTSVYAQYSIVAY